MGQRVGHPKDEEWVPQRAKSGDCMGQRVGAPKDEEWRLYGAESGMPKG